MGRSSLMGIERPEEEAPGHDTAALGPSDSSDSGSDMVGVDEMGDADPMEPVDVALRDDMERPQMPVDSMDGASSDRSGSGERRSAGDDGGVEAADISVDRVFGLGDADEDDALDDALEDAVYEDPADDEYLEDDPEVIAGDTAAIAKGERAELRENGGLPEDESADPVGDGHSDAEAAARTPPKAKPAQKALSKKPVSKTNKAANTG